MNSQENKGNSYNDELIKVSSNSLNRKNTEYVVSQYM